MVDESEELQEFIDQTESIAKELHARPRRRRNKRSSRVRPAQGQSKLSSNDADDKGVGASGSMPSETVGAKPTGLRRNPELESLLSGIEEYLHSEPERMESVGSVATLDNGDTETSFAGENQEQTRNGTLDSSKTDKSYPRVVSRIPGQQKPKMGAQTPKGNTGVQSFPSFDEPINDSVHTQRQDNHEITTTPGGQEMVSSAVGDPREQLHNDSSNFLKNEGIVVSDNTGIDQPAGQNNCILQKDSQTSTQSHSNSETSNPSASETATYTSDKTNSTVHSNTKDSNNESIAYDDDHHPEVVQNFDKNEPIDRKSNNNSLNTHNRNPKISDPNDSVSKGISGDENNQSTELGILKPLEGEPHNTTVQPQLDNVESNISSPASLNTGNSIKTETAPKEASKSNTAPDTPISAEDSRQSIQQEIETLSKEGDSREELKSVKEANATDGLTFKIIEDADTITGDDVSRETPVFDNTEVEEITNSKTGAGTTYCGTVSVADELDERNNLESDGLESNETEKTREVGEHDIISQVDHQEELDKDAKNSLIEEKRKIDFSNEYSGSQKSQESLLQENQDNLPLEVKENLSDRNHDNILSASEESSISEENDGLSDRKAESIVLGADRTSFDSISHDEKHDVNTLKIAENNLDEIASPMIADNEATSAVDTIIEKDTNTDSGFPVIESPSRLNIASDNEENIDRDRVIQEGNNTESIQKVTHSEDDIAISNLDTSKSQSDIFPVSAREDDDNNSINSDPEVKGLDIDESKFRNGSSANIAQPTDSSLLDSVMEETDRFLAELNLDSQSKSLKSEEETKKELREMLKDQPVYIYTSLAGGGFHMIPRTNRLSTILTANRVPYTYRDLGTDDEARKVWKTHGNGRSLPAVVRGRDDIIGNWEEMDEAAENYMVQTLIYETL